MKEKENPEHQGENATEFKSNIFISKTCKQLNIKKQSTQEKKWAKGLNGCIFKEGIEMAIKPVKRCSESLLEKCQSKCSPPQNDHSLKDLQRFSASEGKGSRDSSHTVGEDGNERVWPLRKTVWRFLKALNIVTTRGGKPTPSLRSG